MRTTSRPRPLGAYGIRLRGVDGAAHLLVDVGTDSPVYDLSTERGSAEPVHEHVSGDDATLRLRQGCVIEIDRRAGRAVFRLPEAVRPDELVHPYLAPAAAVIARWLGRESVHAGAYAGREGTWALVGRREGGKSSTLASLAQRGVDVLCDDMLVLEADQTPLVGPRSVDLRQDAAARLGGAEHIGKTGARERWRVQLAADPVVRPLRGWVFLAWGERLQLRRLGASERLQRLAGERALRLPPVRPEAFLEAAGLPAWELCRPRGWQSLAHTADRLLELTDG